MQTDNLGMHFSAFHEAAHAVAAHDRGMREISISLKGSTSSRGVKVNASTGYSRFKRDDEPISSLLERCLMVVLAGPAWELFSLGGETTCKEALTQQKDDRLAAIRLVRELRGVDVQGQALKSVVKNAWQSAQDFVIQRSGAIAHIAMAVDEANELDDTQLRSLLSELCDPRM